MNPEYSTARGPGADSPSPSGLDWLAGGGEMGKLIRAMDWSRTPLGPVESWPQSLRTTVSLCLSSTFPILIAWGPEHVQIYNDSYRPICGEKHPQSMGQRFRECWASALPAVGGVFDRAQQGEGSYIENLRMFLDRYGYLEEAFMTFSFSPIRDESGKVGGLFHPITEVTEKMLSARRTQALRTLSERLGKAKTLQQIWDATVASHDDYALDLPFLLIYQLEGTTAHRVGAAGLATGTPAAPERLETGEPQAPAAWPVARMLQSCQTEQTDALDQRFGPLDCGPYPESPTSALLIPIIPSGMSAPLAFLVAGVSSRRAMDSTYRAFYEQFETTVTTAVSNVRAYEQEQQRAAALAEIDRAKTAFFSNVSHEFRTPLTLMLGPLEESLSTGEGLPPAQRERQQLIHRNALRLLKLVNSLLDFSRIEAGRVKAAYRATDLPKLTADVASSFRSAMEKAGLQYHVTVPDQLEPVYVDHDMWEKIVLNLISNAFKFTLRGEIEVKLALLGDRVRLSVHDTGTGIPESELPRIFERFHRVESSQGRTFEGTGIGLALTQELVKMHGGTLSVQSTQNVGSTFHIDLPLGHDHIPAGHIVSGSAPAGPGTLSASFVEEALRWLPGAEEALDAAAPPALTAEAPAARAVQSQRPRVLVADDNADMRGYIRSLLEQSCVVNTVPDGEAAYEALLEAPPDLVLSDVMMPRLDGFGLIQKLRANPKTQGIPLILLSARAGEEARIEGLQAGADDYLVKPFHARELLARVENAVRLARERLERERQAQERIELEQQLIGIVSHDLRNPISAILMSTSFLFRLGTLDEKSAKVATRIQASADRAMRMVRDLLDFTQARLGGGLRIDRRAAELQHIAWLAIEDVKLAHPERDILFEATDMRTGEWDDDRLFQLVTNLVTNAVKYSPAPTRVTVRLTGTQDEAQLQVHNEGEPIPPELQARLFMPMQQGSGGGDRSGRSIGLGLYIVSQIVRAHGGTIHVVSDPGVGTTFTVHLPLRG
ncbi:ATP-binding response regulator [Stigmatella erecta]|uniref:histidine kinase n=1 Tax=Stigmatella erecta TaxID=83460 RepID=A0A1I0AWZ0_9BACT|nr:ATP-binding protein [Stigmatella erecta]SES98964.1 His Kinase A (phospho-acceptor) domain-containing protein [Stigmatella erecta]